MGGAYSTNGEERNVYSLLVRKAKGNKALRKPRRRWVHNINFVLGVCILLRVQAEGMGLPSSRENCCDDNNPIPLG
jgi:hypothetical protein